MKTVLDWANHLIASRNPERFKFIPDAMYLKIRFYDIFHRKLDFKNPKTFNEKLQWLKLYDRDPLYTTMVDKYEAKKYVADLIGDEYIIPTLGIWENFDDINFEILPDQFVLKCTHDSGGLVVCKDKNHLDIESARMKIEQSLKRNYYYSGREWPYKNVKPRIIAEKYMTDETGELQDYKVHNFGGIPKFILVCSQRFSEKGLCEDFYDTSWKRLDVKRPSHPWTAEGKTAPLELQKMLELSSKLSEDIPFARTDFYLVDGQLYFGEITFFPASGLEKFEPDWWDHKLGDWIKLPVNKIYGGGAH